MPVKGKHLLHYVPHGINTKYFFPRKKSDPVVQDMRSQIFNGDNPDFVLLYNNRNIRRKMTSDALLAFKLFCDKLKEAGDTSDVRFVLKTQPVDENGTDLYAVIDAVS